MQQYSKRGCEGFQRAIAHFVGFICPLVAPTGAKPLHIKNPGTENFSPCRDFYGFAQVQSYAPCVPHQLMVNSLYQEAIIMLNISGAIGIIGGADGPTAIFVSSGETFAVVAAVLVFAAAAALGLWHARHNH